MAKPASMSKSKKKGAKVEFDCTCLSFRRFQSVQQRAESCAADRALKEVGKGDVVVSDGTPQRSLQVQQAERELKEKINMMNKAFIARE